MTELPGVPGLPKAHTGNDIRLVPRRRSRSVEPPASTRSKLRLNDPLWPEYKRSARPTTMTTLEVVADSRITGSWSPATDVALKLAEDGGNVNWTRS